MQALLANVLKLNFLDGYRSYIGGAGFILLGVGMLAVGIMQGTLSEATTGQALAAISAGFGMIGHAGKQDKMINAAQTTASATSATALTSAVPSAIVKASVAVRQQADTTT
jgi:hypothetical protein